MVVTMKPRYAELLICNELATVSSSVALYDQCKVAGSSVLSSIINNVEIAVPDVETETMFFFGQDANGAQNSEVESKPLGDIEVTFTIKKEDFDLDKYQFGSAATSVSGETRYSLGSTASSDFSVAIRIQRTVGATTYTRDWLFQSPIITQVGSWSAGSEDTKLEGDFKLTCPANKTYKSYKSA